MTGEDRSRPAATPGGLKSGQADQRPSYGQPGLDRAVQVARRDWYGQGCARAIRQLAATGRPFTAHDVRDLVGASDDPHMIGAAFAAAQRSKLITVVSAVIGPDGNPRRVWAGEVDAGAGQVSVAEGAPRS